MRLFALTPEPLADKNSGLTEKLSILLFKVLLFRVLEIEATFLAIPVEIASKRAIEKPPLCLLSDG